MQINGISPQVAHVHPLGKPHPKEVKAAETAEQPVTEQESAVEQTTESSDSQGVLRLLQEGHFKGVSNIRLRINFFNELSAIEAEKLQAVANEQIEGILQSVDSIIGGFLEDDNAPSPESSPELLPPPPPATDPPQLAPAPVLKLAPQTPSDDVGNNLVQAIAFKITAATIEPAPAVPPPPPPPPPPPAAPAPPPPDITQIQEDFNQAVNQLKEDFMAADSPSTETLVYGIQSAFDKLIESLESVLAAPNAGNEQTPNIEPSEGGVGVNYLTPEPALAEETPPVIEELTAAFDAALNELIDAFGEVKTLEPASEPNGNGVAYQKFLNIYNEMREGTEQA